jgi:hypothetical protein
MNHANESKTIDQYKNHKIFNKFEKFWQLVYAVARWLRFCSSNASLKQLPISALSTWDRFCECAVKYPFINRFLVDQ